MLQSVSSQVLKDFVYLTDGSNSLEFKSGIEIEGTIQIWPGNAFNSLIDSDFDGIPDVIDGGFSLDFDNDGLPEGQENETDSDNDGVTDWNCGGTDKILTSPYTGVSIYIASDNLPPARFQFRLNETDNWADFEYASYDTWYFNFNSSLFENGDYTSQIRRNGNLNYTAGEWTFDPEIYTFKISINNPTDFPITYIIVPVMIVVIVGTAFVLGRKKKD